MSFERLGWRVEEAILLAIIFLNILDFFELLDPFWDYVKKIVSWVLIGYLLYRASVSDILFGARMKGYDLCFLIAAFAMNINDLVSYAAVARAQMIVRAADYVEFVKAKVVEHADVMVQNVSQGAWNTLELMSVVPEAPSRLVAHAGDVTMGSPTITFLFERGAESLAYTLQPYGINGALLQFYNTIVPLAAPIERWSIILGVLALVALSIFAAVRISVKSPSLMALLDQPGMPQGLANLALRLLIIFFALLFFFLFVFNLLMEWLAIAIDAPLLMAGLAGSILLMLTHHRTFNIAEWVEKIGNFGTEFYSRFIKLFHSKKYVLLGLAGLLVLHVLTEIGNFLLPFVMPFRDQLYLAQLGPGHENLFSLAQFSGSFFDVGIVAVILLNVVAWFLLLALPGYIWYKIFRLRHEDHERHYPRFRPWMLALFFGSLAVMLLNPLIAMHGLDSNSLIGVDLTTRAPDLAMIWPSLMIGLAAFAITYFLALFDRVRTYLTLGPILTAILFLGLYAFHFFTSSFTYYLNAGLASYLVGSYALGTIFFLFLAVSAPFYIFSYLTFLYEIARD